MLKVISSLTLQATTVVLAVGILGAGNGSLSSVDAYARASGTDRATAIQIGKKLFLQSWPAQVLKVYVDAAGSHRIAGLMLSGVKFHRPLTRSQFVDEAVSIVGESFASAAIQEVDLWCVVPLNVGKGVVVSGDRAQPTQRLVFTVSVRKGESPAALRRRIDRSTAVYWDATWAKDAFQRG